MKFSIVLFIIILMSFSSVGLYQSWRMGSIYEEFNKLIQGCIIVYLLLFTIIYLLKLSLFFPRRVILSWAVAWPLVLFVQRATVRSFLRYCRKRGRNIKRAVIAGKTNIGQRLERWINENPWSGTKILGYFDDSYSKTVKSNPCLGSLDELPEYVRNNTVDVVYIALPMREDKKITQLINKLSNSTCSTYLIPDTSFPLKSYADMRFLGNIPVFSIANSHICGINAVLKRAEDIIFGTLFLLLASPVMLIIALAIKLTSPGPVIFKQWRYGLHGKRIQVWKFRTMNVCEDGYKFTQATQNDPRLTKVGAFLRKTSLDELPQFINVLQGRMSIVGPRPHPVAMNERYRKEILGYMLRHKIKPGITGLAQVNGYRGETDRIEKIKKRTEFDLNYLQDWSLLEDLKIIILTPIAILRWMKVNCEIKKNK